MPVRGNDLQGVMPLRGNDLQGVMPLRAKDFGQAFFPVASGPVQVLADAALSAAVGHDLRGVSAHAPKRGLTLGRAGAPQQPLMVFPPVFDTRLYYRFAHDPYRIEDQEDCASCVFISASTCAKVRGGIQSDLPVMNAARVWRQLLREEGERAGAEAGAEAYRRAARRFSEVMCARARAGAAAAAEVSHALLSPSARALPCLDWRRFICCTGSESHDSCGRKSVPDHCYHHRDGDPSEAAFHCDLHSEGVVPLHFVEWVSRVGFHDRDSGKLVVESIAPESVRSFMLTDPVRAVDGQLGENEARAMAEQVRRLKTSIMTHGPVMAMMKIDGRSFDAWGSPSEKAASPKKLAPRSLYARARAVAGRERAKELGEADSGQELEGEEEWGAAGANEESAAGASGGSAAGASGGSAAGASGGSAGGASGGSAAGASGGSAAGSSGEIEKRSGAGPRGVRESRRAGYVLPDRDLFDEFHEVTVVGWGFDDDGAPCWIVLNSYGEDYNDACVPSGSSVEDPWLGDLLDSIARDGYAISGIGDKRGAVFVRMMSPEMLREGRSTDLENNVIAFIPTVAAQGKSRAGAAPPFYDPMGKRVHVLQRSGRARERGGGQESFTGGSASSAPLGVPSSSSSSASWMVAAGVVGVTVGLAAWTSYRETRRR